MCHIASLIYKIIKTNFLNNLHYICNNNDNNDENDLYSLIIACEDANTILALTILSDASDKIVNKVNFEGFTALHYACEYNMDVVACQLIEKMSYETIIESNIWGINCLMIACKNRMNTIALQIIFKICDNTNNYTGILHNDTHMHSAICVFNQTDNFGKTALYWACLNNLSDIALLLIPYMSYSAIEQPDEYENTALILACKNNMCDVAIQLIYIMSDEIINLNDKPALYWAYKHKMNDIIPILEDKMINYLELYDNGLYYACKNGFEEIALKLINNKENCECIFKIEKKHNAYYYACKNHMHQIIKIFKEKIQIYCENVQNKLIFACKYNLMYLVDQIIADPLFDSYDETDIYYKKNALMFACSNKLNNIATKIISKMSNNGINQIDIFGNTALIYSCSRNLNDIALQLINLTSYNLVEHKNNAGLSAKNYAILNYMPEVVSTLLLYNKVN